MKNDINKNSSVDINHSEAILNSISDGVFTVDENWKITSFNRAAEEITGVTKDEAIGARCSDVFRSSICGQECALQNTMDFKKPIINKGCYFINSRGDKIPITISTALLKNKNGKVIGGAETFRDISEIEKLKRTISSQHTTGDIISNSPSMKSVLEFVEVVAKSSSTILIMGETGTGKEVVARSIHKISDRCELPFVAVNCAAIPETLLESELFGHVKGAFTGAVSDKKGLFSRAESGTLFLDEIGDISPALQVRLLRVLQERTYTPVGGVEVRKNKARILTATNRDLKALVAKGEFRRDLYYRLNVIPVNLPSLSNRKEDIPILVESFIEKFNAMHNKEIHSIDPNALSLLSSYGWPGNIRELENTIERACIICDSDKIKIKCLPDEIKVTANSLVSNRHNFYSQRMGAEQEAIVQALTDNENNKTAAAKSLGIHKTTLFRKLKKYNIS